MKYSLLLSSFALLLLFASCQNSYQQNVPAVSNQSPVIGVSNDVFQVTAQEYENYFESRYGLLYQKFNDRPFSGRILTIEQGAGGDYISSDESWAKGKKNGLSARWFSNGMKMYERNYSEGRWHGTVTRWWPNGQKMYVRAYTNGTRHGKEATWRSDGSPINTAVQPVLPRKRNISEIQKSTPSVEDTDSDILPSVVLPSPIEQETIPSFLGNEPATSSLPDPSIPESFDVNSLSEPANNELPSFPDSPSGSDDLPALPGLPDAAGDDLPAFPDSPSGSDDLPALPGLPDAAGDDLPAFPDSPSGSDDLPMLPGLPDAAGDGLPAFPDSPSGNDDLPPLPGLPDSGVDDLPAFPDSPMNNDDLPALPGLPDSTGDDLPPLPGFPDDAGSDLPPFPGAESSDGGLPPLPSFPE